MKIMPDKAWEKVKNKIKVRDCEKDNCKIELDKDGKYHMQIERHAKILWLFEKKMQISAEVDSDSGDPLLCFYLDIHSDSL